MTVRWGDPARTFASTKEVSDGKCSSNLIVNLCFPVVLNTGYRDHMLEDNVVLYGENIPMYEVA